MISGLRKQSIRPKHLLNNSTIFHTPLTDHVNTPSALLGAGGLFAKSIQGFAPRPQQQQMSEAVLAALQMRKTLITEAGTGVGKTFAYLVPALLEEGKVIISTGTRHLQDQLFHRDLPVVMQSLGAGVAIALLKGRANYLCLQRLEEADQVPLKKDQPSHLQAVKVWAEMTRSGDVVELSDIPEDSPVWPKVTSTAENCLGSECPKFNRCYVVKARRRAQEADIVVVNHHLFFADMALKEDGFGEVLPSANTFILDEAHQLPDIATRFFGQSVSSRQLQELVQDSIAAQLREAVDMSIIREQSDALLKATRLFRLQLGQRDEQRRAWHSVYTDALREPFAGLYKALEDLRAVLESAAERGEALLNCLNRSELLLARLKMFKQEQEDAVQWLETFRTSFTLNATPLNVAEIFRRYMSAYDAAWVFTSATLSVNGRFDHFVQRMGLDEAETQQLDSPYDYLNNALLYLPEGMPEPQDPHFTQAVVNAVIPVLKASQGRAFMLFTSHRALKLAAALLAGAVDFPLFVQGDAPRSQLLDQFRFSGNGVLLGTSSFWEGVDIKGEALSCVIIDKLPFAAPDDPVLQARLTLLKAQGGNPFFDYQIPQAVIVLKQGIGRLIRDANDRGILVICDPRLKTKAYGTIFLNSLPKMRHTQQFEDVILFFQGNAKNSEAQHAFDVETVGKQHL